MNERNAGAAVNATYSPNMIKKMGGLRQPGRFKLRKTTKPTCLYITNSLTKLILTVLLNVVHIAR